MTDSWIDTQITIVAFARFHTEPEFRARVEAAVQLVDATRHREGDRPLGNEEIKIATHAAAVALQMSELVFVDGALSPVYADGPHPFISRPYTKTCFAPLRGGGRCEHLPGASMHL